MSSRTRTSARYVHGVDSDGVYHTILVTSTGKIITRITGLDANGVQRTILLNTSGEVIVDLALYLGTPPGVANPIHTQTVWNAVVIDPRTSVVGGVVIDPRAIGRYQATPAILADLAYAPALLDVQGRLYARIAGIDDTDDTIHTFETGNVVDLDGISHYALRISHSHGINAISVTTPGVAYANGANAMCLAAPTDEALCIELEAVYVSAKAVGDFYLVAANLGIAIGSTTANTFDLVGIKGSGLAVNTSDVVWAFFDAASGKSQSGGAMHFDLTDGHELYLIAPDIDYNIVVTWLQERHPA